MQQFYNRWDRHLQDSVCVQLQVCKDRVYWKYHRRSWEGSESERFSDLLHIQLVLQQILRQENIFCGFYFTIWIKK
jgi:hypothetical protein